MVIRKTIIFITITLLLNSCDLWNIQPQPFPIWTSIPSRTPGVQSPTPVIVPWTPTQVQGQESATPTENTPSATSTPALPTDTETPSPTSTVSITQAVEVEILGCDTSIDITHGMGEVTNAYVTIRNRGSLALPDTCALLRALDEGREHPDKKRCLENLPGRSQVTQKLTVDSAFKEDTIIQVDVSSGDSLITRVDESACRKISLFGGAPADIGVIKPTPP